MEIPQIILLVINLLGGGLIIFSYLHGLKKYPAERGAVWGGVPNRLKPWYTVSMLLAAVGYLICLYFIFLGLDWANLSLGAVVLLYICTLMTLFPSALWMPLTFGMLHQPSLWRWRLTRLTLAIVGFGSLGLLGTLVWISGYEGLAIYWLAIVGMALFCVQTALLDALVWTYYFKRSHSHGFPES